MPEKHLKEFGVKIILYGVKYSDPHNAELIQKMIKEIKHDANPIKESPQKPIVHIILPLSAYDYG